MNSLGIMQYDIISIIVKIYWMVHHYPSSGLVFASFVEKGDSDGIFR